MRSRFVTELIARHSPGTEMEIGLQILWEIYRDPRLAAVFELYLATRTDADLREVLEPVVRGHFDEVMKKANALFPGFTDHAAFHQAVVSMMLALQGAALMDGVVPPGLRGEFSLEFLTQGARMFLGAPDVEALRTAWEEC